MGGNASSRMEPHGPTVLTTNDAENAPKVAVVTKGRSRAATLKLRAAGKGHEKRVARQRVNTASRVASMLLRGGRMPATPPAANEADEPGEAGPDAGSFEWALCAETDVVRLEEAQMVSMSADGTRMAVGLPHAHGGAGSVLVYDYVAASSSWEAVGEIRGNTASGRAGYVAISAGGQFVAIGAPGSGAGGGSVRVFQYTPRHDDSIAEWLPAWSEVGAGGLSAHREPLGIIDMEGTMVHPHEYGASVSIVDCEGEALDDGQGADGPIVAVGAPGSNLVAVYQFIDDGGHGGGLVGAEWTRLGPAITAHTAMAASPSKESGSLRGVHGSGGHFGSSIALSYIAGKLSLRVGVRHDEKRLYSALDSSATPTLTFEFSHSPSMPLTEASWFPSSSLVGDVAAGDDNKPGAVPGTMAMSAAAVLGASSVAFSADGCYAAVGDIETRLYRCTSPTASPKSKIG
jgi:hypothetical protein